MQIVPVGPGFAAELRGVTLADIANDDAAYAEARAAFEEHSVLVFRGQEVTDEGQLAFSRRFGPPEVTKVGSLAPRRRGARLASSEREQVPVVDLKPIASGSEAPPARGDTTP